ncbi:hypothetical protein TPA0598_04_03170 [Streptomyces lydicamycinicus]|uniref:Uncharacterized protein n=1 Tax=Streptomyces lydicamycinicus TaxID=1546107 RepID=A0A0P4R6Y3_9ACTN|nr:hypothetical protein [Streptomyces lydicamycinicus]GAO08681.1 hypothetical protein TPA0598_04_03170 [Streptomyces lydicamycinicus]
MTYPSDVAEWPSVELTAICRTPGCPAENIPFTGLYYENPEPPIYRGQCGQCGQPIETLLGDSDGQQISGPTRAS